MAKNTPTQQAQVAKLCRQFLKAANIPGRVTSKSGSMTTSVKVVLMDQKCEVLDSVNKEFMKYEYGSFNGMDDSYNHDNVRDDIPQVKYLTVTNEYSKEMEQAALDFFRSRFGGCEELPVSIDNLTWNEQVHGEYIGTAMHQLINGTSGEPSKEFWATR